MPVVRRAWPLRGVAVKRLALVLPVLMLACASALRAEQHAMSTEHFIIQYPPDAIEKARLVADALEDALPTLAGSMDVTMNQQVRVRLFRTRKQMYEAIGGEPRAFVMGLADGAGNQILLGLFGTESLRQTAQHELAHIVLHHRFGQMHPVDQPRWLHEGFAQLASQELSPGQRQVLGDAVRGDRLLDIDAMELAFKGNSEEVALAYAQAFTLVSYLHGLRPDGGLAELAKSLEQTGDLERAFIRTYGLSRQQIEQQWLREVRDAHLVSGMPLSAEIAIFAAMAVLFLLTLVIVNRRRAVIRRRLQEEEMARLLSHSFDSSARASLLDDVRRHREER